MTENKIFFLNNIREAFPYLEIRDEKLPTIYLDSAATTQKPQVVIDALSKFYSQEYGTVHRSVYSQAQKATESYNAAREKVRKFLGTSSVEEIIFTQGTTASINTVAHSFGKAFVKAKDEIIISELEHHSNIVPWQILCEERGAVLRVIPADESGILDLEAYANLLNEKTKIVSIAHISNAFGTEHPIEKMVEMAHSAGAKFMVDGAQAASHKSLDVQKLQADFYAFSSHKMYGPTGIGILFGKKELLDAMPPYQSGGDMIQSVSLEKSTYNTLPLKFEAGTPIIAEAIGLGAAIDFLQNIGLKDIGLWENSLLDYATSALQKMPLIKIIGTAPKKGPIISFTAGKIHPLDIATMLDLRGIALRSGHHCAQPAMAKYNLSAGTVRISFGVYNTFEEVDRFIEALESIIKILN